MILYESSRKAAEACSIEGKAEELLARALIISQLLRCPAPI